MARVFSSLCLLLLASSAAADDHQCEAESGECPDDFVALQTAAVSSARDSVCSPSGGQSDCDNGGTNLPGSPGTNYQGDARGCQSSCSTTSGCVAWTFLESNQGTGIKQCWLKSSFTVTEGQTCSGQQYNHATSGWCSSSGPSPSPSPGPGKVCSPSGGQSNCDNGGTNLPGSPGNNYQGDARGCQSSCSTTSGCVAWTFLESNQGTGIKQCWLKSSFTVSQGQTCSGQQYNHATSGWCS